MSGATLDSYYKAQPCDRAVMAVNTFKALGCRLDKPRELTEPEVTAGILLGTIIEGAHWDLRNGRLVRVDDE